MLILRGLIGGLFNVAFFGACLIVPAGLVPGGTWYWTRALVFLGVYGFIMVVAIVTLATKAPASLEARLKAPASKKQPVADRIVTAFLVLWFLAWLSFIPVDVFYLKLMSPPQLVVSLFGGVLTLAGYAIVMTAIYQNSFAVPIVEDLTDGGQVLVDTGLYAWVRHPLYLGMLPFVAGIALWLRSYASLIATVGMLVILIARITVEEKSLRKTLPGYTEYIKKVRYRLVPLVW
jgi:protein-S-isoprenylcysteine O-methyltransferase Ste14